MKVLCISKWATASATWAALGVDGSWTLMRPPAEVMMTARSERLLVHWSWTLSSTRKPCAGPSPTTGGGPENASDTEKRVRRP